MMSSSKKSATRWLLNSALAFTLAVSLAGCSGADEETPELQKTSDASLPETADYVPASPNGPAQNVPRPTLSSSAAEQSVEGAKASLEFFWEAEEYARLTGNTEPLSLISAEECGFCNESIEGWKQSYEEGFWNVPEERLEIEVTDVDISTDAMAEPSAAHLYFQLNEPATDFYNSQGEATDESFESPAIRDWFALMYYDATAQRWEIDWVGLEENISWEE